MALTLKEKDQIRKAIADRFGNQGIYDALKEYGEDDTLARSAITEWTAKKQAELERARITVATIEEELA